MGFQEVPDGDKLAKLVGETAKQLYSGGLDENAIYLFFCMGFAAFAKDCVRPIDLCWHDFKKMWDMTRTVGDEQMVIQPIAVDPDVVKEAGREFERWKQLSKGRPGGLVPIAKVKVGKA